MAIDVVDQAIDLYPNETIFVYHQIVHNSHVVSRFEHRGVMFVESLADVPQGSIVVFSAHGVSPALRREAAGRGLRVIDATCPLVTKVHSEAIRYARQGYEILLIGHAEHQEVIGTRGEAPDSIRVIEDVHDAASVEVTDPDNLVFLTQTTLSTDDARAIIDVLRDRFPSIKSPPGEDICYATTNRQHAVRSLATECDLVIVIGSSNSSNSVRLTEISRNAGTEAVRIEDASELRSEWFPSGNETVLVTAGASAPEDLVAELCRTLIGRYGGTIEARDVFVEEMEFALPVALRRELSARGIDADSRRIRVSPPTLSAEAYGAVPLTVSARTNGSNPGEHEA